MARKPAQTEAEDKVKDASVATEAAEPADTDTDQAAPETGATENSNDSGADAAGDASDAREDVPEATDINVANPAWIVTCHREGGRRRAGRRWPKGETRVKGGELTAYDLAILKGDPQFSVRLADRN